MHGRIDVLVHNAGVLPGRAERRRPHDLELTFATHVAGPFLLTRLLETRLAESGDARVVWVSSGGMYTQRLDLADVDWTGREYDGVRAYAETKRAQVVLAELWAEELRATAAWPSMPCTPAGRIRRPWRRRCRVSIG